MKKYFVVIFLLFSGLDPVSFLSGGVITPGAVDYATTFILGVFLPLCFAGVGPADRGFLRVPVTMVLCVVVVRFIFDLGVDPQIARGPMRIYLVAGSYYLTYFVMEKHLHLENLKVVIRYFVGVASFVSVINMLQIVLPDWPLLSGSRSFALTGANVADTYIRFQTTYYHFATLAIVFLAYSLTQAESKPQGRIRNVMLILLNFATVLISGYRANMFALLFTLSAYLVLSYRHLQSSSRKWIVLASIPLVYFVYEYTALRSVETTTVEGENTSIQYRFLEAGLAIEKMEATNAWVIGVGYSDGFINPLAPEPGQETYFLHNGYLSIVYNYGIVGSIAWIILISGVLSFIARHFRQNRSNGLWLLLALHLVGQLLQNFSSGIFNREPSATFAFLFAFSVLEVITHRGADRLSTITPSQTPVVERTE